MIDTSQKTLQERSETLLKVEELEQKIDAVRKAAQAAQRDLVAENTRLIMAQQELQAQLDAKIDPAQAPDERIAQLERQIAYHATQADLETKISRRLLDFHETAANEQNLAFDAIQSTLTTTLTQIEAAVREHSEHVGAQWRALSQLLISTLLTADGEIARKDRPTLDKAIAAMNASELLDTAWYNHINADVASAKIDACEHFLRYGLREGRLPAPSFASQPVSQALASPQALADLIPAEPTSVAEVIAHPKVLAHRQLSKGAREDALHRAAAYGAEVSVIMPTYNRAPTIVRAVRSALEQSVPPKQVIVADDASQDGTIALLHDSFPEEIAVGQLVVLLCEKGGVCKMRNEAMAAAKGNVLAFLDSDNFWHPDHLLWALAALEFGGAQSVYTAANIHHLSDHWSRVDSKPYDRKQLLTQNFIDLNCFVHRTELFHQHGGFDLSLTRLVDWDYVIRMTRDSIPTRVPVPTVEYFLDKNALSNISFTFSLQENAMRIQIKHREEMRAHTVLNANAEARLDAFLKTLSEEKAPAKDVPAPKPAKAVAPAQAKTPVPVSLHPSAANMSRMPYFGGFTLFVVLPTGIAIPEDLPLDFVRARFVHLLGAGQWQEVSRQPGATPPVRKGLPHGNYWYPDLRQPLPSPHQLATLVSATQLTEITMAIGSYTLDMPPAVAVECFRNQVVVRNQEAENLVFGRAFQNTMKAKVLRVPQGSSDKAQTRDLSVLMGRKVHFGKDGQYFAFEAAPKLPSFRKQQPVQAIAPVVGRRRVLVLAQKLAVGGVERNTIEVARQLKSNHDCIYLTLEKVKAEAGSLTHQAVEACINTIDLAEIGHHDIFPAMLERLEALYEPDNLWICNGSMWLCAQAERIRKIFNATGIVDQQVYDAEAGWIRRYPEPGIQSFDRFIAINRKIHEKFISDLKIDADRIDLIYSAINASRFRAARAAGYDRAAQRQIYNLPQDKTILTFMGRLVDQKRPLDFLTIAKLCTTRPDLHFVLVGNGERAPDVEDFLKENNLPNLTWIKNVPDTTTYWPAVDGYVVTSEYEGLPIALIEAISLGVPVIATDVGDIRFVLEKYNAGQVVDEIGNPEKFVVALDDFLKASAARTTALQASGEQIIDFFSAETISRQFAQSFDRAASRRPVRKVDS